MGKRRDNGTERERHMLAQEAARIIVEQGLRDYGLAKQKAAERLGYGGRGALPGNTEIEAAVAAHLQLFGREAHDDRLREMRVAALDAMALFEDFSPRLVGPVLAGTADENSAVNLHLFADSPEAVAMELAARGLAYKPYERRLRKTRAGEPDAYAGFAFHHGGYPVEATVFPVDGIRQAPLSPINGRPMQRLDAAGVRRLIEHV